MKEQRIESILSSLKKCDYLTRSQIQSIHKLKGDRNANRFLQSMDEYLSSFRSGLEKVYYLNKRGRERINCSVIRKKTPQVHHYLLRNQLWIHLKRPSSWETEVKINIGEESIQPDAMFYHKDTAVFVEVDVSQSMAVNQRKIEKYRRMQEISSEPFYLLFVTEMDSRKKRIEKLMSGSSGQVYTASEIK
ncbi:replication-relaxation family protein [Halobacillus salinus]|uniref:replication-relaxation family protein n=1 Tax=Halobacillus salinus TaxID=192814 RepID=UPI001591127F|nr:replication-relaxation family protein [Halobacillus salinus]